MINKAQLDENNIVLNIAVFDENSSYISTETWVTYTEKNPAYIGGDYFDNYFYPPKPFNSWTRDGEGNWIPPVPKPAPTVETVWVWNEEEQKWTN